jgi:transcriptional regulator with XRE-family HTH domain
MALSALVGTRLRERRLAAGLKQADLAAAAGVSASYLNLIEHNRRNVTPPVLARLAAALGVDPAVLGEGTAGALAEDLRAAAAAMPAAGAELDRIDELIARYPGWAALAGGLQGRVAALERAFAALNDRMSHDPHLSAALHELLSALSGVRATASILAETEDIDPDWRARFHRNLYADSERLAEGAEALVAYLDRSETEPEEGLATPQDQAEGWLAARGWHLAEADLPEGMAGLREEIAGIASGAARALAGARLVQAREDAALLPRAAFAQALAEEGPDPARLAARFGAGVLAAMRRIALWPGATAGLVACDASGTLTFRKPTDGFALPRFGAACPLWPLFAALARPGLPVEARLETAGPAGGAFRALAFCEARQPFGFAGPDLREAAMLILPDPTPPAGRAALAVGSTCRICARVACPARREPSILREAQ